MRIFLDESGCLGANLSLAGTSKHFVVTLLIAKNEQPIIKAIERTLRNKINYKKKNPRSIVQELKGTNTSMAVKQYFYNIISDVDFVIHSLIIDKTVALDVLNNDRDRFYNHMASILIKHCGLHEAKGMIILTLDKSKGLKDQQIFNQTLISRLKGELPLRTLFKINHVSSEANKAIQAVDMFSWGIYRKYEHDDTEWYNVYTDKIKNEVLVKK